VLNFVRRREDPFHGRLLRTQSLYDAAIFFYANFMLSATLFR
jgi:hypothetical protein